MRAGYVAGQVEVVSRCYQHCKFCDSWRDDASGAQKGEWSLFELQTLCRELEKQHPFEHLTLTGGDPQAWRHLEPFIEWFYGNEGPSFHLQINTALTEKINSDLWIKLHDIRVSLDAVDRDLYRKIRGDKDTDPLKVLLRLEILKHPRWAANVTVYRENVEHLLQICNTLACMVSKPRKVIFMAGIGPRVKDFWESFEAETTRIDEIDWPFEISTNVESPVQVRQYLESDSSNEIRCWAGAITFHIKANQDVYPCCLVGGEAIPTVESFKLGNYSEHSLEDMLRYYEPKKCYADKDLPCSEICQWKQSTLNIAAEAASKITLAMP